ncbi:unnamed protein product [Lactuca saligna]|uniref:Uncharacterized protein n=1 Tax=Lactuca saligna TaxID=75948 RepID=A0AA35YCE9_LACSI|nr:unnamed protein product [Lactuca saligna]
MKLYPWPSFESCTCGDVGTSTVCVFRLQYSIVYNFVLSHRYSLILPIQMNRQNLKTLTPFTVGVTIFSNMDFGLKFMSCGLHLLHHHICNQKEKQYLHAHIRPDEPLPPTSSPHVLRSSRPSFSKPKKYSKKNLLKVLANKSTNKGPPFT